MKSTLARLPKGKELKRLKGLSGPKQPKQPKLELPALPQAIDLADSQEDILIRALGDERLAKRIRKLQDEFPVGSVPELIVYDFLKRYNIPFQYQIAMFGGRARAGGLVPDFLLQGEHAGTVWQIQGDYWHTRPGKRETDEINRLRIMSGMYDGQRIKSVLFLWENHLMDRATRSKTLRLALGGIEMPGR